MGKDEGPPTLWDAVASDVGKLMDPDPVARDVLAGRAARDVALAQVGRHTPESYRAGFEAVVRDFWLARRSFSSEDVTERIGQPPNHPNAVGALTRAVARSYGAVKVGRVQAKRTNQHATEIALWGWPE
jgi:hypothetical protein